MTPFLHLEAGWVFKEQLTTPVAADGSGESVELLCTKLQGPSTLWLCLPMT